MAARVRPGAWARPGTLRAPRSPSSPGRPTRARGRSAQAWHPTFGRTYRSWEKEKKSGSSPALAQGIGSFLSQEPYSFRAWGLSPAVTRRTRCNAAGRGSRPAAAGDQRRHYPQAILRWPR